MCRIQFPLMEIPGLGGIPKTLIYEGKSSKWNRRRKKSRRLRVLKNHRWAWALALHTAESHLACETQEEEDQRILTFLAGEGL